MQDVDADITPALLRYYAGGIAANPVSDRRKSWLYTVVSPRVIRDHPHIEILPFLG